MMSKQVQNFDEVTDIWLDHFSFDQLSFGVYR